MQQKYTVSRVIKNLEILSGILRLTVEGDYEVKPGQFFMLRAWERELLLSRPVSVHDCTDGELSFLYEVRGEGTKLLSRLKQGDKIELLGPLGNGFDVEGVRGRVAVVTGGLGIAPMQYLVKSLKGCEIDLYAGFRDSVYGIEEISKSAQAIFISSQKGSVGYRGYITDLFSPMEYNVVLCCGPEEMMRRVGEMCRDSGTPVYLSLESHMACGIGACLVCTCKVKDGNKRVCKDGPVFSGREVIANA